MLQLFDRLEQYGLVVNPDKCILGVAKLDFLGYQIDRRGACLPRSSVQAIEQFPQPKDIAELMRFNGMLNFYHRFVPNLAQIMKPLYQVTSGNKPKTTKVGWTGELDAAFQHAKKALANACMLVHPRPDAPIAVTTDASDIALGAVLEQCVDGLWQPIAFFSRKLKPAEVKYSTYDRELLAIYAALRHFKYFLEGRQFAVYTDHRPLTHLMTKISDPDSARQQRQASSISQ